MTLNDSNSTSSRHLCEQKVQSIDQIAKAFYLFRDFDYENDYVLDTYKEKQKRLLMRRNRSKLIDQLNPHRISINEMIADDFYDHKF